MKQIITNEDLKSILEINERLVRENSELTRKLESSNRKIKAISIYTDTLRTRVVGTMRSISQGMIPADRNYSNGRIDSVEAIAEGIEALLKN